MVLCSLFIGATRGFEFLCNFQNRNWEIVGTVYTCYVTEVSVSNNSFSLEAVQGDHLFGKNNGDVEALHVLKDATLSEQLPKHIETFFPNLSVIVWEVGYLTSVTADDLHSFPELKVLSLYINEIVSLDGDLFQHTPKLSWVSFSFNLIKNVGENLLANLDSLTYVNFLENNCINATAGSFQEIQEIKLNLSSQCSAFTTVSPSTTFPTTTTTTVAISTPETTTEAACYVRCLVNDEIDEQNRLISQQAETIEILHETVNGLNDAKTEQTRIIDELQVTAANQNELISNFEARIAELEKQLKVILSRP